MVDGIFLDDSCFSAGPAHVFSCWDPAFVQYMALVDYGRPLLPSPTSLYRLVSYT